MISNAITGVSVMGAKEGTILQQGVVRSDPEVSEEPMAAGPASLHITNPSLLHNGRAFQASRQSCNRRFPMMRQRECGRLGYTR